MKTMHAFVSGVVQKVGFRTFVKSEADSLGLKGFVMNAPDGRVEVRAQGDPESLERFERSLWRGPREADVFSIDVEWAEEDNQYARFDILY